MYTLTFEKHLPRTLKLSCIFELPEKPLKGSNVSPSAQVSCLIGLGRSLFFFFFLFLLKVPVDPNVQQSLCHTRL